MKKVAVHCTNLTKSFGKALAVDSVCLEVEQGSLLAMLGPSGCGKTTLLRLIAGLDTPDKGTIEVDGRMVAGPGVFVPPEKRKVGIVFQDYALFPHLDVSANIAYGLSRNSERKERIQDMLSLVGLKGSDSKMPHELSGGEQQRVALARALAPEPEVILLDEPFSSLDADLRNRVRIEVKDILAHAETTVIFVTHDQEEALFMGDLVGVMNFGKLEQVDTPENIFHRPATPFVAQFIGVADFLKGEIHDRNIITELGCMPIKEKLTDGTVVRVMVRPDFIGIKAAADGKGIIVDRVFQGIYYLYSVKLPSGAIIKSLQHHNRYYSMNTRVLIKMNPGHNVVYFVD